MAILINPAPALLSAPIAYQRQTTPPEISRRAAGTAGTSWNAVFQRLAACS
jgi:hypothetical protein